jgi:hypothetical protein
MFRKITLALAAATVVATAAIPTTASANHWRHHRHHHSGVTIGLYAPYPYYAYAPRCYWTKKWVHTRWGWQRVAVRRCG